MKILTDGQLEEVLDAERYRESREQYVQRKKDEGFEIYTPEDNELLLDIDSEEAYQTFLVRFERLKEEIEDAMGYDCGSLIYKVYDSATEGHRHIIVTLPFEVNMHERIALQAVLGSDPVREMLSIFRVWQGDPYPTLLAMKGDRQKDE